MITFYFNLFMVMCEDLTHSEHRVDMMHLFCIRWGYLSRAGLWDKSHLMRQIEKYVLFS